MRNAGLILLCGGILAFFYCGTQLAGLTPVPEGVSLGDSLGYAAGKWELLRYASGLGAFIGLLLAFFPKGR